MFGVSILLLATLAIACSVDEQTATATEPTPKPPAQAETSEPKQEPPGAPRGGPIWFEGPERLPGGHPCHDEATVFQLVCENDECAAAEEWGFSLGHGYEDSDALLPRAVRGVRWREDGGERMLATCTISGRGLLSGQRYRRDWGYRLPINDRRSGRTDPVWLFNDVAHPAHRETFDHAVVRWMRRASPHAEWETVRAIDRSADLDTYGLQEEVTHLRSMPLTARDADTDGVPETSAMVVWEVEGKPALLELEAREGDSWCYRLLFLGPDSTVVESVTRGECVAKPPRLPDYERRTDKLGRFPASSGEYNHTLEDLLSHDEPRALAAIGGLLPSKL